MLGLERLLLLFQPHLDLVGGLVVVREPGTQEEGDEKKSNESLHGQGNGVAERELGGGESSEMNCSSCRGVE